MRPLHSKWREVKLWIRCVCIGRDKAVGCVTDSYKQVEADTGRIDVTIMKLEYMNNIGAYSNADNNLK